MSPRSPRVTDEDDYIITTKEISKALNVSVGTVLKLITSGELKGMLVGRQYRVWATDYQAWQDRMSIAGSAAQRNFQAAKEAADKEEPQAS